MFRAPRRRSASHPDFSAALAASLALAPLTLNMTTNHTHPLTGHCLCGDTTIILDTEDTGEQVACHCQDCKRTSGSAFSTNALVLQREVTIKGPIKTYDTKGPTGNTVSRIFCSKCGSAISHKSQAFGDAQAIQTGNFTAYSRVPFHSELFTKDRWAGIPPLPHAKQIAAMV
ncbi:Mss4-like protein [Lyophyllum atratum]|nr:Mss4-like protein [Lyophyllum atratum]